MRQWIYYSCVVSISWINSDLFFSLSFEIDVNQFRSKQICSMVFVWIKIIRNKRQFSSCRSMLKRTILVSSCVWYPQKCYTSILVIYLYFETWVDENSSIVEITVHISTFHINRWGSRFWFVSFKDALNERNRNITFLLLQVSSFFIRLRFIAWFDTCIHFVIRYF